MKRSLSLLLFFLFLASPLFSQVEPPTNLTAVQVNNPRNVAVQLTWSPSVTASVKYDLYKKTNSSQFKLKAHRLTDTVFVDDYEDPGDTLSYYVVAYVDTVRSAASNTVTIILVEPPPIVGIIKGNVVADSTGLPLKKVYVRLFSVRTECEGDVAVTDSLGNFSFEADSGNYYVSFKREGYVSEYYDNVGAITYATVVHLGVGDTLTCNASLAKYWPLPKYTLKGKVTDTAGVALKATVKLFRLRANTFHWSSISTKTDNQGAYSFTVTQGDTVIVYAEARTPKTYYPEYYNNKTTFELADRIAIAGNVVDINLSLEKVPPLPNGISGTIKDTLGNPVPAHVAFYRMKNGHPDKKYVVVSDSLGVYSFTNMGVGKYILKAVPMNDFKATYFKYDGSNTLNWRMADSVMVDSFHVVANINFVVREMRDTGHGRISGVVKGVRNEVIPGAMVYLVNSKNEVFSYAVTNNSGKYVIDGIVSGTYRVVTDLVDYAPTTISNVVVNYAANINQTVSMSIAPYSVTDVEQESAVASSYELSQNYPNPFNPSTTIRFSLPERNDIRLAVYDMIGSEVAVLASGTMSAGTYSVTFDGSKLASGVYIYHLTAGAQVLSHKLILMK